MHTHAQMLPASGDLILLFGASVLASAHCVGMCGPYVTLCGARLAPQGSSVGLRLLLRILFNVGRISSYAVVGLLAGAFGQVALAVASRSGVTALPGVVALVAGLFATLFGLAVMGFLTDPTRLLGGSGFNVLVRGGMLRAFRAPPYVAATLLGCLQGAFPCALVYGAASRAAMAGSAGAGATTMLVFGLGTVPAIFALSLIPAAIVARLGIRRQWAGAFLVAVGALLILRGIAGFGWIPHGALW